MTRARASLPTLIAAVERASGRLDGSSPPLRSEGLIALEQTFLADVVAELEEGAAAKARLAELEAWLAAHRSVIVDALSRKATP